MTSDVATAERFDGRFFGGAGDVEYLRLLDIGRRMFAPDPEFQNVAMLYTPAWNGFVEGPTWGAWWIQNSYGTTYAALPFYTEPYVTFLQNAQDLWFDQMGDGKRAGAHDWVAPDGALCDAASPGWIVYKQGDGRIDIHDWGMEFTAAGLLMQAELLLISRDVDALAHYLPKLERCANFIETRRDPEKNLFLAGPAGNLLAPSYAGWKRPDGTHDKAYLTGLSITYIAALDRLIELEKLAGNMDKAALYGDRRDRARQGLPNVTTDEGYFIKSLDPDGTRHGVYGAEKHGYFEASPNHDAIAFRVVDDAQAEQIYAKIAAIPGLRRHTFIIANEPGLDDMYDPGTSWLWKHGTWVNGGHWSTCEGRMVLGYYRLGKYEDARRSMQQLLTFARRFRMDNPLVEFGSKVYQPKQPINLCYDTFAPAAAFVRGLFEYLYRADGLTLIPHVPPGITRLEQRFPIRFGAKKLYLSTVGTGPITGVWVNGDGWPHFDGGSVLLPYEDTPDAAHVQIAFGDAKFDGLSPYKPLEAETSMPPRDDAFRDLASILPNACANQLPLRIGADSHGKSRFIGDIGRVQIFRSALGDDQIKLLAQNESAGAPSLVADWAFERQTDGVFQNAAGAALPARIVGTVEIVDASVGPSRPVGPSRREGPSPAKAARLTGQGYLEVPHGPALDLREAFTLAAWIAPAEFPDTGARIIDKIPVGADDGYLLDTCPKDALRVISEQGALTHQAHPSGVTHAAPPAGTWSHVAATFEAGGELRLYVNGERVAATKAAPRRPSPDLERVRAFYDRLVKAGLGGCYEAEHAKLAIEYVGTLRQRRALLEKGTIEPLPEPSQSAADKSYMETVIKLCEGLRNVVQAYADSQQPEQRRIYTLWLESEKA